MQEHVFIDYQYFQINLITFIISIKMKNLISKSICIKVMQSMRCKC